MSAIRAWIPGAQRDVGLEQHLVDSALQFLPPLCDADAALEQDRPELVHQCPPDADQSLTYPVNRLHVELPFRLQRHETHGRTRSGFGDCLGIAVIVLLRLGPNILGRHQPHLVPLTGEDPADVMRAAARFHGDHADRQIGREPDQRLSPHPSTQLHGTTGVETDDSANVLAQIDTQYCNSHGSLLPQPGDITIRDAASGAGHSMKVAGRHRTPPRQGKTTARRLDEAPSPRHRRPARAGGVSRRNRREDEPHAPPR